MIKIIKKLISHANVLAELVPDELATRCLNCADLDKDNKEYKDWHKQVGNHHEAVIKEAEKLLEEVAAIQEKAEKWDEYIQDVIKRTLPQEDK